MLREVHCQLEWYERMVGCARWSNVCISTRDIKRKQSVIGSMGGYDVIGAARRTVTKRDKLQRRMMKDDKF